MRMKMRIYCRQLSGSLTDSLLELKKKDGDLLEVAEWPPDR